ncbi:hypothetical protein BJ508DRAFT_303371 [Ascobolus immersus RN42]|uniref:Uncharacterized protein n=1 Tax=Ascobolus immersus RN42 TaxID=1160509 RepID=A0A3N4ILH0_ASCIM|nr:hypothetical protein BJ508DRAFT_303371 [Ascobolus immersus RN42]
MAPRASFSTLPPELHLIIGTHLDYEHSMYEHLGHPAPFHALSLTSRYIRQCYAPLTQPTPYFQHYIAAQLLNQCNLVDGKVCYARPISTYIRRLVLGGVEYIQRFLEAWYGEWWSQRALKAWYDDEWWCQDQPGPPELYRLGIENGRYVALRECLADVPDVILGEFYHISALIIALLVRGCCDAFDWVSKLKGLRTVAEAERVLRYVLLEDETVVDIVHGFHEYCPDISMSTAPFDRAKILTFLWPANEHVPLLVKPHVECAKILVEVGGLEAKLTVRMWDDAFGAGLVVGNVEFVEFVAELGPATQCLFSESNFSYYLFEYPGHYEEDLVARKIQIFQTYFCLLKVDEPGDMVLLQYIFRRVSRLLMTAHSQASWMYVTSLVQEGLKILRSSAYAEYSVAFFFRDFAATVRLALNYSARRDEKAQAAALRVATMLLEAENGTNGVDLSTSIEWVLGWGIHEKSTPENREYALQAIKVLMGSGRQKFSLGLARARRIEVAKNQYRRLPELWGDAWAEIEKACGG